jgi:anti-sigma regulatory factor (Ser/Thr protein kinase)
MTAHPLRLAGSRPTGSGWHWLAPAVEMAASASGNWLAEPSAAMLSWTFPRVATSTPDTDHRSVRAARDFTAETLQRWGAVQRLEDIAMVVSELLTNALRHAPPGAGDARLRWPVRLGLLQLGSCVLSAVADPSDQAPAPREPGHLGESGRGLHVVGALSDTWGYTPPSDQGKIVWALFAA